jgi:hypothetical protein
MSEESRNKKPSLTDEWETSLQIDAMYFHAARQAHARAEAKLPEIRKAEDNWKSLDQECEDVLSKHDDNHSAYDELEPIAIQLEGAHYSIGEAYAPLLKEIAVVHILCTATLEAHINSVAKGMLQGKEQDLFERLSLEAKWLFLPKILGFSGFNPGCEPFQSFARLLGYRNDLIHYKELKEKWVYGSVPQFINLLGLTIEDSRKSIATVVGMVRELAQQRNTELPYWLREDLNEMSYFEILSE